MMNGDDVHIIWLLARQSQVHMDRAVNVLLRSPNVSRVFSKMQVGVDGNLERLILSERYTMHRRIRVAVYLRDRAF